MKSVRRSLPTCLLVLGVSLLVIGICLVPNHQLFAQPPGGGIMCDGPGTCDLTNCGFQYPNCPSLGPGFCKSIAACTSCSCRKSLSAAECACS
jgi:hypothetical protein